MPRQRPWRRGAPSVVLALALIVGCGSEGTDEATSQRSTTSASSPTSTEPDPASALSDPFSAQMGAMDTVLVYCIPGLPGSPREGCNLDRILSGIGEVTTGMREEIDAHPDPETFAEVTAAIDGLDSASTELGSCDTWFNSGGVDTDPAVSTACSGAWSSLTDSWEALKPAVGWP